MSTSAPAVSVLLPTYNRGHTLPLAIDSVLSQSFSDLELIVIDDGSTDGSLSFLQSISDSRVHIVRLSKRLGASAARNAGIERACGKYVAFQDSDDVWRAGKLATQVATMEEAASNVTVVYGSIIRHRSDHILRLPRSCDTVLNGDLRKILAVDNFISLPAALVRAGALKAVGGFDSQLPRFQDWDLWLTLARTGQFQYVDQVLLDSPEMPGSITLDRDAYFRALKLILAKHHDLFQCVPEAALKHHLQLARGAFSAGSLCELQQELREAWSVASWRTLPAIARGGWTACARLRRRAPGK